MNPFVPKDLEYLEHLLFTAENTFQTSTGGLVRAYGLYGVSRFPQMYFVDSQIVRHDGSTS